MLSSTSSSRSPPVSFSELVRIQVPDWDDEVLALARFKAFTGQRSDWEQRYFFWRDLILKVARALDVCIISANEVKKVWFVQGGLTPLCIDQVLMEMYDSSEIILESELINPTNGRLYQMIKSFSSFMGLSRQSSPLDERKGFLVLKSLLQDKAQYIIKDLSESHWTLNCIITLEKLQSYCKNSNEACAILSYLTQSRRARYFSIRKADFIEGIKVCLEQTMVDNISTLDCDVLHLVWTVERLQKQLEAIDKRWLISRKLAVASGRSGNKEAAYRYIRQTKLFDESRKKCTSFLERVEDVISIISNIETTRKVSAAIEVGSHAIKQQKIDIEDVLQNLHLLDEAIASQKEVEGILGSKSFQYIDISDEDLEEEFNNMEEELECSDLERKLLVAQETKPNDMRGEEDADIPCEGSQDVLCESLSKLDLQAA